jgi:allantoinase
LSAEARRADRTGVADYLASRPVEAELKAICLAIELAGETGCRLHVVHVSSPEGVEMIARARKGGVDVTGELCSHYLLLTEKDVNDLGAPAKCAPPLRDALRQEQQWALWGSADFLTLGSDHSPSPPEMKTSADFFAVWGGIGGCQHGFPLVAAQVFHDQRGGMTLAGMSASLSERVAHRFGVSARKGKLAVGFDADLTIMDFSVGETIRAEALHYRHKISPYVGREMRAGFRSVWRRGTRVDAGNVSGGGQWLGRA